MLVVLSNGAGEDAIAASILSHLPTNLNIRVYPLVGTGQAYGKRWPQTTDTSNIPSQGLSNQSWKLLLRDIQQGLIGRVLHQLLHLRQLRHCAALAVGDLFPCILAALAGLRPVYFIGTAKSVYHHSYSWPERYILKKWIKHSLVRDQPTADFLLQHGVQASYMGNAMMDEVLPSGLNLGFDQALAIFPGSRAQAASELPRQLRIWKKLTTRVPCPAAVAVAPGMDLASLVPDNFSLHLTNEQRGVVGWLEPADGSTTRVALVRGALGDLLAHSWVALGQAGTAHEQAAGAGIPVVSLHKNPTGYLGWYRGRQKGLLGDALLVVSEDEDEAVIALTGLFLDPSERARRGEIGRQRMGQPGGAARIAAWLARQF